MIQFEQSLVLLALPVVALVAAVLELRLPGSPGRRVLRFVARSLVLGLAIVALAGPYRTHDVERPRRLVVAIDRDARLPATAAGEAAAVLAAAGSAADAAGVATSEVTYEGEATTGLARARLVLEDGETGGILLVTDGRGRLDGMGAAVAALRREGLAVTGAAVPETVPATPPRRAIEALDVPRTARGAFGVRAALAGPAEAGERVVLRVDGAEVQALPVDVEGAAEVRFDDLDLAAGLHELSLSVERPDGAVTAHARRLVTVEAPARVVSLTRRAGSSPWRRALSAQGLQVAEADPDALGALLTEEGALPELVVADAAALVTLDPETALLLARRVRAGLGLLVEPGTDPGAWAELANSPVAAVLPLLPMPEPEPPPPEPKPEPPPEPPPEIDPPEPEEGPGLKAERRPEEALPITLLLVVDRSPSMREGAKMGMAILGAQEAARALSPWDRVGVITFADDVTLDISPRSARGASSIPLWLSTVEPGGRGTNIAGALKKAREVLARERSPILHLILLTDGRQYPAGPIFGPIVKPMRQRGITITAVGIGAGARMDQLRDIVRWAASGMVIRAATPRDIPIILTRDTRGVAARRSEQAQALDARLRKERDPLPPREPEQDEPTPPPQPPVDPPAAEPEPRPAEAAKRLALRLVRPHEALGGFDGASWPDVGPPRRTSVAPGAAVLLARSDGSPVLAAARPGLGRVLQWTLPPDDAGALGWEPLGRLFGQAARAVMAPRGAFGYLPTLRVTHGPDGERLHVDWPRGTSTGVLEVRWHGPEGVQALGRFTPDQQGGARALPHAAPGSLCRLEGTLPGGPVLPPVSYLAREQTQPSARPADARALVAALDAPLVPPARFVRALPTVARSVREPLWPWLVWLSVALLPLDVFLHRRRTRL